MEDMSIVGCGGGKRVQIWDAVTHEQTGGQPITEFWQQASVVEWLQLRGLWCIIW